MTNHPNRNWRKRWTVDLSTCTATHESGFVMTYKKTSDEHIDGTFDNANDWLKTQKDKTSKKVEKLVSEAGVIYKEALDARQ